MTAHRFDTALAHVNSCDVHNAIASSLPLATNVLHAYDILAFRPGLPGSCSCARRSCRPGPTPGLPLQARQRYTGAPSSRGITPSPAQVGSEGHLSLPGAQQHAYLAAALLLYKRKNISVKKPVFGAQLDAICDSQIPNLGGHLPRWSTNCKVGWWTHAWESHRWIPCMHWASLLAPAPRSPAPVLRRHAHCEVHHLVFAAVRHDQSTVVALLEAQLFTCTFTVTSKPPAACCSLLVNGVHQREFDGGNCRTKGLCRTAGLSPEPVL